MPITLRLFFLLCVSALLLVAADVFALQVDSTTVTFLKDLNRALGCKWNDAADPCSYSGVTCTNNGDGYAAVKIYMHAKSLSGYLPDVRSTGSRITEINLKNNQNIRGNFPDSWYRLARLTSLDLSYTSLTGQIPDSWDAMSALQTLSIRHTKACYRLPNWYGYSMSSIRTIDLDYNNLYDLNAEGFGHLSSAYKLRTVSLLGNPLCGCATTEWSTNGALRSALSGALPSALEDSCVANCTETRKCKTNASLTTPVFAVGTLAAGLATLAALLV